MADIQSTIPAVEYREIARFPGYRFGEDGSVQSCRSINGRGPLLDWWRPMSPCDQRGYRRVGLRVGGRKSYFYVHGLILEAFVGPRPDGMTCCHNDGVRTNNRIENLRWDTHANNIADQSRHGTRVLGDRVAHAKLNDDKVREIFLRHSMGHRGIDIARDMEVGQDCIYAVIRGTNWKHVDITQEMVS